MSIQEEKLENEPVNDVVYNNLVTLQNILKRMRDVYFNTLRAGQPGLSEEFDRVLLSAAEKFTPEQKFALKQHANPKALGEWRRANANSYKPEDITNFLRHCFSDTCGHILSYTILPSSKPDQPNESDLSNNMIHRSDVTDKMAMRGLEMACLVNSGFDSIATNFQLILGEDIKKYPALETTLKAFKESVRDTNKGIDDLGESLHCDLAMVASIAREMSRENLDKTTSISYIQPLEPSLWK